MSALRLIIGVALISTPIVTGLAALHRRIGPEDFRALLAILLGAIAFAALVTTGVAVLIGVNP